MITEDTVSNQQSATFLTLLKNHNFLLLWVAQILSQTAQQIINYALIIQVSSIAHSSTAVSGIIISFTLPAILFAAVAGVFVERNSKKTALVVTNIARGVLVLAYVFTDQRWGAVLPVFYIVTLVFAAVSQFFNPAELATIPLLVKRSELVQANSLFNLSFTACQLLGFVILGPLLLATVLHNNYPLLYMILCAIYLICAVLTYFLPQDDKAQTAAERRRRGEKVGVSEVAAGAGEIARTGLAAARQELVEGWQYVRRDSVIFSAIIYWSIAITVFMMLGAIGPGFLENVLNVDANQLIYIMMPGGFGLVIGVLVVGKFATPHNRLAMINVALVSAGVVLLVFALVEPITSGLFGVVGKTPPANLMLGLLGLMAFLLGLLNSFISVPAQTALQERSHEDFRARVFSFFFTAQNVILIVPVFFAGALADSLGYPQTVAMIAMVVLGIAGTGLYRMYKARQAEEEAESERPNGRPTAEELEAALRVGAPPNQPVPMGARRDDKPKS